MALRKCPRCELNYIKGDAPYCNVCMAELKRAPGAKKTEDDSSEPMMCTECGEAPAIAGYELCAECLKEQKRQQELEDASGLILDEDAIEHSEPEEEEE